MPAYVALCGLDAVDRALAGAAVFGRVEGDLLAFHEAAHASTLQSGGVNEDVLAAVVRLNEAITLLVVVELHGTRVHRECPCRLSAREPRARKSTTSRPGLSMSGRKSERAPEPGSRQYGPIVRPNLDPLHMGPDHGLCKAHVI